MEEIRINKDGCNSKKERCNCESCNAKFNSTRLFKMFYEEFDIDSFLNKITGKDYYYDLTDSYHYLLSSRDFEKIKNLIEHIMNDREDELYIFMSDYFRKSKNKEKERHYLMKFIQTQQEGVIDFRYMRAILELGISYLNSKILDKAGEYLTKLCSIISIKKTESKDNMYKIFAKNGYYYYGNRKFRHGHYYHKNYRYYNGRRYRAVEGKYGYYRSRSTYQRSSDYRNRNRPLYKHIE